MQIDVVVYSAMRKSAVM